MKVILHNFKCYRGTRIFEFSEAGLTLISGPSGVGKSSILEAICFALYGASAAKYTTNGEVGCKVTLEYLDYTIVRTSRPNTVALTYQDQVYQHDDAQARISDYFGAYFESLNYIPQQVHKTFLYATAAEKLNILETLLFQNNLEMRPAELKARCTDRLKILASHQDSTGGKLELLERQLKEFSLNPNEVIIDPVDSSLEKRALFLFNKQRLYDAYLQTTTLLEHNIALWTQELAELPNYSEYIPSIDNESLRKHILALEELEKFPWTEYTEYTEQECKETIDEYTHDISILREHKRLTDTQFALSFDTSKLDQIEEDIRTLEQTPEDSFQCPACSSALVLVSGELVVETATKPLLPIDVKRQRMYTLTKNRDELVKKRAVYDSLSEQIQQLSLPEESLPELEDQLRKWQTYRAHAQKIARFAGFIYDKELTLKDARQKLMMNIEARSAQELSKTKQKAITEATEHLRELRNAANAQNLQDCRVELSSIEKQLANHQLRVKLFEEQERYQQTLAEIQELRALSALLVKRREALQALKSLISRAEMQYIEQTARAIEQLVNLYASELFAEDVITIKFSLYTESKVMGVKPQLDIEIYYKNMKCAPIALSGGEQARLNICFTLALSKYFEGKLLLLDECTAQLNQEASEIVFDVLKRHTHCKTIVVAHQVVQGIFDEVVTV